jgi:hypothetical protein
MSLAQAATPAICISDEGRRTCPFMPVLLRERVHLFGDTDCVRDSRNDNCVLQKTSQYQSN